MEAVARQLILTRHRSVPQNERSMNKYSCGNDPQPGDVVEVVTMEDLLPESCNWAKEVGLVLNKEYTVNNLSVNDVWVRLKGERLLHHPSRFRLIRRAGKPERERGWTINGEQQQPDMAKMPETSREKLLILAEWFDKVYKDSGKSDDVQKDLRKIASELEEKEREIEMLKKLIPRPIITGEKCFTVAYMRDTLGLLDKEEITYSRFVELLNERVEVYKDEAIRELVVSLNDIIMQHVTANFKTKEDQSEYNASLRRARLLITKYSKK